MNSSRQKISKYFSVYFSAQTCKGSSYNYPSLDFVTNQKKRLFIVFGKLFLHGYDLISYDFTLRNFFYFRFYKKSNRTAQSSSLNARYGILSREVITPGLVKFHFVTLQRGCRYVDVGVKYDTFGFLA